MSAVSEHHSAPCTTSDDDLVALGGREALGDYMAALYQRRHFARALAESDLRAKHMNSMLGQLWHLLNPAMMIAVYFVVFGVILDARRGVEHYVTFLVTGVIVFRFCQNTILGCGKSLDTNEGLIRSIQFPRALVPIAEVLSNLMALVPALGLVAIVAVFDGVSPTWRLVALPLVIAAATLFSAGFGFAVARAGSALKDLQQVLPHFFRVMLYVSGVLFSVDAAIERESVRELFALNPFYSILTATRWSLLGMHASGWVFVSLAVWTVVVLTAGFAWFRRGESRYGA